MNRGSRSGLISIVCVLAFAALAVGGVLSGRFLNDEGLLTHLFASMVGHAPAATLFLQKSRPPISALYAPFAAMGVRPFLLVHVLVAAVGVAAVAATAKRLGHRRPFVPAAVMALSPLYLGASAAGLSNTDAVAMIAVAGWLSSRGRSTGAAVVLGIVPWVRGETMLLTALFAGAMLRERKWWALVGLGAFGAAYGLAGAIYHQDLLWMVHFPPALSEPMPGNPFWRTHEGAPGFELVTGTFLAITPVVALCVLVRARALAGWERLGVVFVVALALVLLVFPQWRLFNFDLSPRYLLPVLPFVALLIGRATEAWDRADRPWARTLGLAGLGGFAAAAAVQGAHPSGLIAVGVVSTVVALAWAGRGSLAWAGAGGLLAAGPWAFDDGAKVDRESMAPHLGELVDRLAELEVRQARPVYTNEPLLAVHLGWTGALPWARVHYLVQADQRYELDTLANPWNGQKEALWDALRHDFYGEPVLPGQLEPDGLPADAIFAVTKDERLELVLPPELWGTRLHVLHPGYGTVVAEVASLESEGSR